MKLQLDLLASHLHFFLGIDDVCHRDPCLIRKMLCSVPYHRRNDNTDLGSRLIVQPMMEKGSFNLSFAMSFNAMCGVDEENGLEFYLKKKIFFLSQMELLESHKETVYFRLSKSEMYSALFTNVRRIYRTLALSASSEGDFSALKLYCIDCRFNLKSGIFLDMASYRSSLKLQDK